MCELMGMSFAKPVVASVSIGAFSLRSQENTDGWGLAWYPDRSLAMIKQPMRWSVQDTQFLDKYPGLLSSIYVAHVRQKTTGSTPTHADTHPFARELGGREYCFAHNGTLTGEFWNQPLGRFRPVGSTDSEFLFCLLLAEVERFGRLVRELEETRHAEVNGKSAPRSVPSTPTAGEKNHQAVGPNGEAGVYRLEPCDGRLETEQQWKWLHQLLLHLNTFGRLNCILTDGERLIVYHDKNAWKGLTYRKVFLHQDSAQHFGDATMAVALQAEPVNHGCIVATNPLSLEGWERFVPGEMKVLYQGNIVFSNRPSLQEGNAKTKVSKDTIKSKPATTEPQIVTTKG